MYIILDSSIFIEDLRLADTEFRVLFEGLRRGGHKLLVPDIVFHETTNKQRERLREDFDRATSALRKFSKLAAKTFSLPLVDADLPRLSTEYEAWLRKLLTDAGA